MPRAPRRSTMLLLAAAVIACGNPTLAEGVSLETYVEAMAALRRIQDSPTLPAPVKQLARDSVLRAHGVTAEQLESAAAVLADDPTRALATWQAIERRVSGADSVAPSPAPAVSVPSPGGVPVQTPRSVPAVTPGSAPPR